MDISRNTNPEFISPLVLFDDRLIYSNLDKLLIATALQVK